MVQQAKEEDETAEKPALRWKIASRVSQKSPTAEEEEKDCGVDSCVDCNDAPPNL